MKYSQKETKSLEDEDIECGPSEKKVGDDSESGESEEEADNMTEMAHKVPRFPSYHCNRCSIQGHPRKKPASTTNLAHWVKQAKALYRCRSERWHKARATQRNRSLFFGPV